MALLLSSHTSRRVLHPQMDTRRPRSGFCTREIPGDDFRISHPCCFNSPPHPSLHFSIMVLLASIKFIPLPPPPHKVTPFSLSSHAEMFLQNVHICTGVKAGQCRKLTGGKSVPWKCRIGGGLYGCRGLPKKIKKWVLDNNFSSVKGTLFLN